VAVQEPERYAGTDSNGMPLHVARTRSCLTDECAAQPCLCSREEETGSEVVARWREKSVGGHSGEGILPA